MLLQDIAYDVRWDRFYECKSEFTVYIKENGVWTPFLVLTANYPGQGNGEVLLLRKYLVEEYIQWHGGRRFLHQEQGYYPNSTIDTWLNTEYLQRFSPSIQERILVTNVEVWDGRERPNMNRPQSANNRISTQIIERQVFLLSVTEMGGTVRWDAVEGEVLDYFNRELIELSTGRRITPTERFHLYMQRHATVHDGRKVPLPIDTSQNLYDLDWWWLRSRRRSVADNTVGIMRESSHSASEHELEQRHARPAFCLSRDTEVHLMELDGSFIYVIHDQILG